MILSALAIIGGVDTRSRLGGFVRHVTYGPSTITHIKTIGKLKIQVHNPSVVKRAMYGQMSNMSGPHFSIKKFLNDSTTDRISTVWASLIASAGYHFGSTDSSTNNATKASGKS